MLSLRRAIEQLTKAEYDAAEAAAPLTKIASGVSQSEIRALKKPERSNLSGGARLFSRFIERRESMSQSWGEEPPPSSVSDYQVQADARVVATRVDAVDRRIAEQSQSGGRPKQRERRFGFSLRKKRGA